MFAVFAKGACESSGKNRRRPYDSWWTGVWIGH
jgi:hypothetical protein